MKWICEGHRWVHAEACPGCLHREIDELKRENTRLKTIICEFGELLVQDSITEDEAHRMQDLLRFVE